MISLPVVGFQAKLNLWMTYASCHFHYFAPAIALCRKLGKFERLYTASLKKALDLPMATPNILMLSALGVPSLLQVAAHHIVITQSVTKSRFKECPVSLVSLAAELKQPAEEFLELHMSTPIKQESKSSLIVDLLSSRSFLNRCYVGLITGSFLTIRNCKDDEGPIGSIQSCPVCKVRADQRHFLNVCPANSTPRKILLNALPSTYFTVPFLKNGDIYSFYLNARNLQILCSKELSQENPLPTELYTNLALAAAAIASLFVSSSVALFSSA